MAIEAEARSRDLENELTPAELVRELDRFVVGQAEAKRAVATALRARWRARLVDHRSEGGISSRHVLMIGPSGVGKTAIARTVAQLTGAPFIKVNVSRLLEAGDTVESLIRALVEESAWMLRDHASLSVKIEAERQSEERLLDALVPDFSEPHGDERIVHGGIILQDSAGIGHVGEGGGDRREIVRHLLRSGALDEHVIELEVGGIAHAQIEVGGDGARSSEMGAVFRSDELYPPLVLSPHEHRRISVAEARQLLLSELEQSLLNHEQVALEALRHAEENGIVVLDQIDFLCASDSSRAASHQRESVQHALLSLIEGLAVPTRFGVVRSHQMLFIASGEFAEHQPSDLLPQLCASFPVRVELRRLTAADLIRILSDLEHSPTKQCAKLLRSDGVEIEFTPDGTDELAQCAMKLNARIHDTGARRIYALIERVLDDLSFSADQRRGEIVKIDRWYVRERIGEISDDDRLSRVLL